MKTKRTNWKLKAQYLAREVDCLHTTLTRLELDHQKTVFARDEAQIGLSKVAVQLSLQIQGRNNLLRAMQDIGTVIRVSTASQDKTEDAVERG